MPLARRYLLAEKVRFLMSIAGVAFAVLLVLVVASLYRGWSESSEFFNQLPGDLWVAQEGTTDPLRSSSYLPATAAGDFSQLGGVAAVVPVYSRRVAVPSVGPDLSMHVMSFVVPPGVPISPDDRARFFPAEGSLIVDRVFADDAGLAVGDRIELLGQAFTIEHIVPGGNPVFALAFANGSDASHLLGLEGYVNFFVLALEPGATVEQVAATAEAERRARTRTRDLSGGEKQRVSIARAIANHPPLLLADEPTANLDSRNGHAVMELLTHLARAQGTAVVVVSHDTRLQHLADSVLWIEDGRLREPNGPSALPDAV